MSTKKPKKNKFIDFFDQEDTPAEESRMTDDNGIDISQIQEEEDVDDPSENEDGSKIESEPQKKSALRKKARQIPKKKSKLPKTAQPKETERPKRVAVSLSTRQQVIADFDKGLKRTEIQKKHSLPKSTVNDIIKNRENIMRIVQEAPATHFETTKKAQSMNFLDLQTTLGKWVLVQAGKGKVVSQQSILLKAKEVQREIVDEITGGDQEQIDRLKVEDPQFFNFRASRGWFQRFKTRADLRRVKLHGESSSADKTLAKDWTQVFQTEVMVKDWDPRQIFNVDETGLMWKKSPNSTFIPTTFVAPSGFKPDKKRITILFGCNAAGHKLVPFVINQFRKPQAFGRTDPEDLGVYWGHNKKAWMTALEFRRWFEEYFIPEVMEYLASEGLPQKVLLLVDNAPGHPRDISSNHPNVEVMFLPPNTTSLIQPLDQGVIRSFKAKYMQAFLENILASKDTSYAEAAKNFNIRDGVVAVVKAWSEVTTETASNGWNKILCAEDDESVEDRGVEELATLIRLQNEAGLTDMEVDVAEELTNGFPDELLHGNEEDPTDIELLPEEGDVLDREEELSGRQVDDIIQKIEILIETINKVDPNRYRCESFKREMSKISQPYRLLQQTKNCLKVQPKITAFWKKKVATKRCIEPVQAHAKKARQLHSEKDANPVIPEMHSSRASTEDVSEKDTPLATQASLGEETRRNAVNDSSKHLESRQPENTVEASCPIAPHDSNDLSLAIYDSPGIGEGANAEEVCSKTLEPAKQDYPGVGANAKEVCSTTLEPAKQDYPGVGASLNFQDHYENDGDISMSQGESEEESKSTGRDEYTGAGEMNNAGVLSFETETDMPFMAQETSRDSCSPPPMSPSMLDMTSDYTLHVEMSQLDFPLQPLHVLQDVIVEVTDTTLQTEREKGPTREVEPTVVSIKAHQNSLNSDTLVISEKKKHVSKIEKMKPGCPDFEGWVNSQLDAPVPSDLDSQSQTEDESQSQGDQMTQLPTEFHNLKSAGADNLDKSASKEAHNLEPMTLTELCDHLKEDCEGNTYVRVEQPPDGYFDLEAAFYPLRGNSNVVQGLITPPYIKALSCCHIISSNLARTLLDNRSNGDLSLHILTLPKHPNPLRYELSRRNCSARYDFDFGSKAIHNTYLKNYNTYCIYFKISVCLLLQYFH